MNPTALDKIKRLLRLGRSPNQHEAASAMAMAAKLALKHQIDLEGVKADEDREQIAHEWFGSRAAYNLVEDASVTVVISIFPVNAVTTRSQMAFIGTPTAIESARWALSFLIECAGRELKLWRAHRRATRGGRPTRSAERNWLEGWKYGILRQAREERQQTPELQDAKAAIILADQSQQRDRYVEEQLSPRKARASKPRKGDVNAFLSGMRAGMETKLNRPIQGNSKEALALEGEVRS